MAKKLNEEDIAFRHLVVKAEADLDLVACCLDITRSAVSHRLNTQKHGTWWAAYKKNRSKVRAQERRRRYLERRAEREQRN